MCGFSENKLCIGHVDRGWNIWYPSTNEAYSIILGDIMLNNIEKKSREQFLYISLKFDNIKLLKYIWLWYFKNIFLPQFGQCFAKQALNSKEYKYIQRDDFGLEIAMTDD